MYLVPKLTVFSPSASPRAQILSVLHCLSYGLAVTLPESTHEHVQAMTVLQRRESLPPSFTCCQLFLLTSLPAPVFWAIFQSLYLFTSYDISGWLYWIRFMSYLYSIRTCQLQLRPVILHTETKRQHGKASLWPRFLSMSEVNAESKSGKLEDDERREK